MENFKGNFSLLRGRPFDDSNDDYYDEDDGRPRLGRLEGQLLRETAAIVSL